MDQLVDRNGDRWSVTVEDSFGTWYARPRGGVQTRPCLMDKRTASALYQRLLAEGEDPKMRKGP